MQTEVPDSLSDWDSLRNGITENISWFWGLGSALQRVKGRGGSRLSELWEQALGEARAASRQLTHERSRNITSGFDVKHSQDVPLHLGSCIRRFWCQPGIWSVGVLTRRHVLLSLSSWHPAGRVPRAAGVGFTREYVDYCAV